MLAYDEAQWWVRNHPDEAARMAVAHMPEVDVATMREALDHVPFDLRLLPNTVEGFERSSVPVLVREGWIERAFDPRPAIEPRFAAEAERSVPEFFADLEPIPPERRLVDLLCNSKRRSG
jgi:ABC-type nitrate/sulfonate/bicarbonate transport system substrate-binding protein